MDNLPAAQGQLITAQSETKLAPGLCSPGLKKLLTEGDDAGGACRLIHLNAKLRAECRQILPALQASKAPAAEVEVLEILVRNAPTYGITAAGAGGWELFFGAYLDALEGLPAYAIEDAFLRWNRGEGHANLQMASFYPKPGQLVQLAQKGKQELWLAAYRAEKALAYAEAHAKPPPEVRKEVGNKLGDLLGELARSRKAPDPFRPKLSPQETAAVVRAQADAAATGTGFVKVGPEGIDYVDPSVVQVGCDASAEDDVGDVI